MTKEALKFALEALEEVVKWYQVRDKNDEPLPVHNQNPEIKASIEAISAIKEALAQPEQEPVAWRNAAIRVGEDLCSVGPFNYYDMTAEQWLDWALSVVTVHAPQPQRKPQIWEHEGYDALCQELELWKAEAQRKPLTDEEINQIADEFIVNYRIPAGSHYDFARAIEAAHGIKGEA